jgi:hypothetical protein
MTLFRHLSPHILKFRTATILKNSVKENNDQLKLVGMFMNFQCKKRHLSKRNRSRVLSIQ